MSKVPYVLFPLILGAGALAWVVTAEHGHLLARVMHREAKQDDQDRRVAEIVAPGPPPEAPIQMEVKGSGPLRIERAQATNDQVVVYYGNYSDGTKVCGIKFEISQLTATKTVVSQAGGYVSIYGSGAGQLEPGEHGVATYGIPINPLASKLRITGGWSPYGC